MIRVLLLLFFWAGLFKGVVAQQLNCECYKNDSLMYTACKMYMQQCYGSNPKVYFQGSKASQMGMDSIIEICPYFSYAYYTKAIPYLKRGEFIKWKELIDKAVEYNPEEYLGYRAGARFMFLHDYNGALLDIEKLERIIDYDIGYIYNGDYHLKEIKALIYKFIGDKAKAISILKTHLNQNSSSIFGFLHLGVLYLESGNYEKAISAFNKQLKLYSFAEVHYYLALTYKRTNNNSLFKKHIDISLKEYKGNNTMARDFMYYPDKIFLNDIEVVIITK